MLVYRNSPFYRLLLKAQHPNCRFTSNCPKRLNFLLWSSVNMNYVQNSSPWCKYTSFDSSGSTSLTPFPIFYSFNPALLSCRIRAQNICLLEICSYPPAPVASITFGHSDWCMERGKATVSDREIDTQTETDRHIQTYIFRQTKTDRHRHIDKHTDK